MEFVLLGPLLGVIPFVWMPAAGELVLTGLWIWMLVDAVLREDWEYSQESPNAKILWIVAMAVVQLVAIAYFFLVFAKAKRGTVPRPDGAQVAKAGTA